MGRRGSGVRGVGHRHVRQHRGGAGPRRLRLRGDRLPAHPAQRERRRAAAPTSPRRGDPQHRACVAQRAGRHRTGARRRGRRRHRPAGRHPGGGRRRRGGLPVPAAGRAQLRSHPPEPGLRRRVPRATGEVLRDDRVGAGDRPPRCHLRHPGSGRCLRRSRRPLHQHGHVVAAAPPPGGGDGRHRCRARRLPPGRHRARDARRQRCVRRRAGGGRDLALARGEAGEG